MTVVPPLARSLMSARQAPGMSGHAEHPEAIGGAGASSRRPWCSGSPGNARQRRLRPGQDRAAPLLSGVAAPVDGGVAWKAAGSTATRCARLPTRDRPPRNPPAAPRSRGNSPAAATSDLQHGRYLHKPGRLRRPGHLPDEVERRGAVRGSGAGPLRAARPRHGGGSSRASTEFDEGAQSVAETGHQDATMRESTGGRPRGRGQGPGGAAQPRGNCRWTGATMGETRKFTILHSNDMHGDFLAEQAAGGGELDRRACPCSPATSTRCAPRRRTSSTSSRATWCRGPSSTPTSRAPPPCPHKRDP